MLRAFTGNLDRGKTFRPRRNHREGTKRYQLHKFAQVRRAAGRGWLRRLNGGRFC